MEATQTSLRNIKGSSINGFRISLNAVLVHSAASRQDLDATRHSTGMSFRPYGAMPPEWSSHFSLDLCDVIENTSQCLRDQGQKRAP